MYLLFTPIMLLILAIIILWYNPAGGLIHTLGIVVLAAACFKLGTGLNKYVLSLYLKMLKEEVWDDEETINSALNREPQFKTMPDKAKDGLKSLMRSAANATLSTIEDVFVYGKSED